MAKFLFFIIIAFSFAACKDGWDSEDKKAFYNDCVEQANTWAGSEARSKEYCDCVMEKMLKKFPREADALEHIDSVINDPDITACKVEAMRK